jgi:hypothetical protein
MGRKVKIFRTLSQTECTRKGLMGVIPQAVDEVPETLRKGFGGSDDEDRRLVLGDGPLAPWVTWFHANTA